MRMVVDGEWPADFQPPSEHEGKPRYEDMVAYCTLHGCVVSLSAIGRWAVGLRIMSKYRRAAGVVREVMKDVTAEKASATQKAVAEMITAEAIGLLGESDGLTAKQIQEVARAIKDCTNIAINADKYIREQWAVKAEKAAESTRKKLTKAGVNRKLIQEIIDEHLGVVKS